MTLLDALDDAHLLAPLFGASWNRWRAFLAAVYGLPLTGEGLALYQQCTGRRQPPEAPAREAWCVVGRRGGKSQVAALLAVYAAAFKDWRPYLAAGERATVAVIAADRQAPSPEMANALRDDFVAQYTLDLPGAVRCFGEDFAACTAHLRFPLPTAR